VLLVDDEIETRKILSTVVERAGAEVKTCTSASEALATLVQWRPHVILSDIGIPDEDGYSSSRASDRCLTNTVAARLRQL